MNNENFMIGDWVLVNGTPMQIQAVNDIDGEIMAGDELYCLIEDRVHSEDNIEPIPLTAEILEKNGFGDSFATNEKIFKCEDFEIWIDFKEQGYWACIKNKVGDLYFEGNKKYVHELQHALRLCGIDKTIDI